jgi:uncharacterized protein YjbI with pentapeptide repeats
VSLQGTRVIGSVLADCHADRLDAVDSSWREAVLRGCRVGALLAHGATLGWVRIEGAKLDFVNLRGAALTDVVFQDCRLGEVDLGDATLTGVRLAGCRIEQLQMTGARLTDVDLRGSTLQGVGGIDGLAGATVGEAQLLHLAPLLAERLGIRVAPDLAG